MYLTQKIKLKSSNISTQYIRVSDPFIHQAKDGMKSKSFVMVFDLFRDCYLVMIILATILSFKNPHLLIEHDFLVITKMALWRLAIGYLNTKLFKSFQSFIHNACVFHILFQL